MTARKDDSEKNRLDLLSPWATEGLGRVLTHGAKKYADHNWRKGMDWSRLIAAAKRHLLAFEKGEDIDPESGHPHIDHAAACIHFLSEYQKLGNGIDDRWELPRTGEGTLQSELKEGFEMPAWVAIYDSASGWDVHKEATPESKPTVPEQVSKPAKSMDRVLAALKRFQDLDAIPEPKPTVPDQSRTFAALHNDMKHALTSKAKTAKSTSRRRTRSPRRQK